MNREQLAHILRAASTIAEERDVLYGSQSILGAFDESELPPEAVGSIEADVTFFNDPEDVKSDAVDWAIGEESDFHQLYGYYAQGVSVTTAHLPAGWQSRTIVFENLSSQPGRGICLEPHDLVVSKLYAGREKDHVFAAALLKNGLIDPSVVIERAQHLNAIGAHIRRIVEWVQAWQRHHGLREP